MSAPVDLNNPGATDGSRLDQPTDAVRMENMPQPSTDPVKPADVAGTEVDEKKPAVEPSPSDAAPTDNSEKPVAIGEDQSAAPKGKEKDSSTLAAPAPPAKAERQDSIMAIGPAQDEIKAGTPGAPDTGPVCNITLLLTSGSRHPYRIDGKYLNRRNVAIPEETEGGQPDPFSISIYTLKELILREWRSDWEAKPASPSSIRLIHFGKLLDDKEQLKKYQFSTETPNVVHMSIRPQDLDEEEPKSGSKNAGSGGDGARQRTGGCCVIL